MEQMSLNKLIISEMNFDQLILVFAILTFIALIIGIVYYFPILFAKIRAGSFGLNLSYNDSKILAKDKCLQRDFLLGLREIWDIYPFELRKLTNHYLAGGNLYNIKSGLIEFKKRNKEPNEWFLTTFDLAKRDLVEEISKAEKNEWKFEL